LSILGLRLGCAARSKACFRDSRRPAASAEDVGTGLATGQLMAAPHEGDEARRLRRGPDDCPTEPDSDMKTVYLSLGSNLGDRAERLREALRLLEQGGLRVRRISPVYETEPQDLRDQPWFLNLVAEVETELFPRQMLARIQSIEWKMGRRRSRPKGPREIDIDVLLYGSMVLRMPELTVPHPRMSERRFVLQPLADLAPELRHPVSGRTILELLAEIRGQTVRQVGPLPYEAGNTGGAAGVS